MPTVAAIQPGAGPLRLARAGVLTVVILALSAVAHRAAGGTLPGLLVTVVLGELIWALAFVCARWRLSPPALTALLGTGQFLLHKAFIAFSAPVAGLAVPTHQHGQAASVTLSSPSVHTTTAAMPASMSLAMTVAHIAATVALVLVLSVGEQAVWRLWCWLTPIALRWPALAAPQRVRLAAMPPAGPRRTVVLRLLAADPRRGPPLRSAG